MLIIPKEKSNWVDQAVGNVHPPAVFFKRHHTDSKKKTKKWNQHFWGQNDIKKVFWENIRNWRFFTMNWSSVCSAYNLTFEVIISDLSLCNLVHITAKRPLNEKFSTECYFIPAAEVHLQDFAGSWFWKQVSTARVTSFFKKDFPESFGPIHALEM